MVSRVFRDVILRNRKLWYAILLEQQKCHFGFTRHPYTCPAVVRDIPMAPYPNFKLIEGGHRGTQPVEYMWSLRRLQWPVLRGHSKDESFNDEEVAALAAHQIKCARLTHGDCCGLCGGKHRHLPVWGLGLRVCSGCLKANFVSSASLMHEYDFDFTKHTERIGGRVFFVHHTFSSRFAAQYVTDNPLDFQEERDNVLLYFWRPHLQRLFDLEAGRAALHCPERRGAASRITAAVRALGVRLLVGQKGKATARMGSHKFFASAGAEPKAKTGGQFWSSDPLSKEELAVINAHLPLCYGRRPLIEQESEARRLLQRSFLAFRGSLKLCAAKKPASVLEALRMSEATRNGRCVRVRTPSFFVTYQTFREWQDMVPRLPL